MTAVKKDPYDKTSSKRAAAHLARLAVAKGKRLPVDLSADHIAKLNDLIKSGFGSTAAEVIRKAIDQAHENLKKKA